MDVWILKRSSIGKDGERVKTFYSDPFDFPLPPGHRFPIEKYTRLRNNLLDQGVLNNQDLIISEPARGEEILLAHQAAYLERVINGSLCEREIRRIGLPWSNELVERSRRSIGGSISACQAAVLEGTSVNLGGGIHHAHHDFGSGYCLFNDCAIAARTMQVRDLVEQVLILDCDVHQGDGTAAIFSTDATVFTFSIHGKRNFPYHKRRSDLDIPLKDGTGDEDYLQAIKSGLRRIFDEFKTDLVIYLAGADPYFDDRLGRLALAKDGLVARDQMVISCCQVAGIPLAVVLAGGYARSIDDTVEIHSNTIRLVVQIADDNSI